ncbi:MAG TPA: potassium-transporting ATPase subunit KdpC [Polyangia bacterium]|jgi:K+-transporting ATPase ATPase C chain|nr:potassium-transporting ATPase subunit KdpC [Polyangia bacterium]
MRKEIMIALRATLVTLILTGILYPLATTGAAEALFGERANGSLAHNETGQVVGSLLLGQTFASPAYLQGRPSAAGNGYDPTASSGSNFGTTSKKLRDRAVADLARLQKENPQAPLPIPDALVTASASGLDPELPPEAALWQAPRVAHARNVAEDRVRAVIENHVEARDLGFLGEPRVNVLELNLALDQQFGRPPSLPTSTTVAGTR